jgi:hypothetical protein
MEKGKIKGLQGGGGGGGKELILDMVNFPFYRISGSTANELP